MNKIRDIGITKLYLFKLIKLIYLDLNFEFIFYEYNFYKLHIKIICK